MNITKLLMGLVYVLFLAKAAFEIWRTYWKKTPVPENNRFQKYLFLIMTTLLTVNTLILVRCYILFTTQGVGRKEAILWVMSISGISFYISVISLIGSFCCFKKGSYILFAWAGLCLFLSFVAGLASVEIYYPALSREYGESIQRSKGMLNTPSEKKPVQSTKQESIKK